MSKGPWGSEPSTPHAVATRAAKSPIGRFLGIALVVAILFGGVVFAKYRSDQASRNERMPRSAYDTVIALAQRCSSLRAPIRSAMADGFITRAEAQTIADLALARQKAYLDAAARRDAAQAVGAPKVAVPSECQNVDDVIRQGFGPDFLG